MILLRRRRNRKKRAVCVRDILYWNNVKLTLLFLLWCPFPHFFDFLFASSLFFYVCLTSWSSSSMICLDLLFMPDEHLFSWCPHHFLFFFPSLLFSLHESLTSWTLSSFLVSLLWLPSPDEFPASFFVIVLSCLFSPSSQCFTQQMSVEREKESSMTSLENESKYDQRYFYHQEDVNFLSFDSDGVILSTFFYRKSLFPVTLSL